MILTKDSKTRENRNHNDYEALIPYNKRPENLGA